MYVTWQLLGRNFQYTVILYGCNQKNTLSAGICLEAHSSNFSMSLLYSYQPTCRPEVVHTHIFHHFHSVQRLSGVVACSRFRSHPHPSSRWLVGQKNQYQWQTNSSWNLFFVTWVLVIDFIKLLAFYTPDVSVLVLLLVSSMYIGVVIEESCI